MHDVEAKTIREQQREREKRIRRQVLEPDTLQALLPLRAPVVARASGRPEVRARERQFAGSSPAYAEAVRTPDAFAANICVTTLDSLVWSVPLLTPDDAESVQRYLQHQDFPFRAITQTRELALGGVMIDIGANIGRMSIPRVILGDVTVAYCLEPDPLNYACLVRNIHANGLAGLVLPDRLALGASNGTARFERAKSPGGHRVIGDADPSRREVLEVPLSTLDHWLARVGVDLDLVRFVKLDVQGAEVDVLLGAPGVLAARHIVWQIEVDGERLDRRGREQTDLLGLLAHSFTHFVDLHRLAPGPRLRRVDELGEALAYLTAPDQGRTDLLLATLGPS